MGHGYQICQSVAAECLFPSLPPMYVASTSTGPPSAEDGAVRGVRP